VLWAEGLLLDDQRALIEGFGVGVVALGSVKFREVIEGGGHVWVLWAEGLLIDGQRPLIERFGLGDVPFRFVERSEVIK